MPSCIKCRESCFVELNRKKFCEFFDAKGANRHSETLEESLCIFSFLLIDSQWGTAICIVQCLGQVIQHTLNTCRKSATEPVNLADNPSKPTGLCQRLLQKVKSYEGLHAICSSRQGIDDKLLVLFFPFPHPPVRTNNILDVLVYVLLLPALIMK